ncbi:MAG: hypothetical protein JSV62_07070 [Promethearchaeota archaeon]|nr:MAG: hypothetical protein JSV62_07070 [Candidatus Lokiarchaeota archaeon]
MPVDPATAVYNLMQADPNIIAAAVIKGKEIVYTTDNWDISGDVDRVISSWVGQNAPFIMVSGVKYSILQMETERLVAISLKGEGSICAAKDEEHKLICYLQPDGDARGAIMDVQRAVGSMSAQGPYMDSSAQLGQQATQMGGSSSEGYTTSAGAGPSVDPQLKGEIQSFLDWIKDSEGLAGYINYYLQQNNAQVISELSKIYNELRQIFGV